MGEVAQQVRRITELAGECGVAEVRVAEDEAERALLWKGRKSAFRRRRQPRARLLPTRTRSCRARNSLRCSPPSTRLSTGTKVTVLNVFHAGDGNLHPILAYDAREPGVIDRVYAAGREIIQVSLAAGGALSGEHGIGVEKRDFMDQMFSPADLDHQNLLRRAFDPHCRMNPGKVLPSAHTCADIASLREADGAIWG